MIDNVTHKATRVDLWPVRLDVILHEPSHRRLLTGWLLGQLTNAALRLYPEFQPSERTLLLGHPIVPEVPDEKQPFLPRWRRRLYSGYDDDGGI